MWPLAAVGQHLGNIAAPGSAQRSREGLDRGAALAGITWL